MCVCLFIAFGCQHELVAEVEEEIEKMKPDEETVEISKSMFFLR